jgi:small subunit ribosomal protein S6
VSKRTYEILFIAESNLGEAEVDALTETVKGFVEKEHGVVDKIEKWGKKRLATPIGRHREGSYVLLFVTGPATLMSEVDRRMRVTDGIVRSLTVRTDAELKKADRRKAARTRKEAARRHTEREKERAFEGGVA